MQQTKTLGIIQTVIGAAIGIWVFARFTSFVGQLCTWQPPFSEYEITTLIGAAIAIILVIVGVINMTKKQLY